MNPNDSAPEWPLINLDGVELNLARASDEPQNAKEPIVRLILLLSNDTKPITAIFIENIRETKPSDSSSK
jgi:hypothetical protein